MSAYAIWLDQQEARIFKFMPGRGSGRESVDARILHRKELRHSTDRNENTQKFYHELAGHIDDATELLILGPGLGKAQFKKHLEEHHHGRLAKSIVGVEPMDHPTENQIIASARRFFHRWNLFNL